MFPTLITTWNIAHNLPANLFNAIYEYTLLICTSNNFTTYSYLFFNLKTSFENKTKLYLQNAVHTRIYFFSYKNNSFLNIITFCIQNSKKMKTTIWKLIFQTKHYDFAICQNYQGWNVWGCKVTLSKQNDY